MRNNCYTRISGIGILFVIALLLFGNKTMAQPCGVNVPAFVADLRNNPDSVWISPNISRNDTCCGSTNPDRCIQFTLFLHPEATAIIFDIASGAIPPGALYYQISCGPPVAVGEKLCLSGMGPHHITFCKPGNNQNEYRITSIGEPEASGDIIIGQGCSGTIFGTGFDISTITWQSVGNDSTLNSYLSCSTACDTTHVLAQPGYPPYGDYVICGVPEGACDNIVVCDTTRVYFVSDIRVKILPDSPIVCYGGKPAKIWVKGSGGKTPYAFTWSTGETSDTIEVTQGEYYVEMDDATDCPPVYDTIYVDSFSFPITSLPGNDTSFCDIAGGIQLNGNVLGAAGGIWSEGKGSYFPSDTMLNVIYQPTINEIISGILNLKLTTTGNRGCPGDSAMITFKFNNSPNPGIIGSNKACRNTGGYVFSNPYPNDGSTYSWSVDTAGSITRFSGQDSVYVEWFDVDSGKVYITETDSNGCIGMDSMTVYIYPTPDEVVFGPDTACEFSSGNIYYVNDTSTYIYDWTVTGGNITSGNDSSEISVSWLDAGPGVVYVKITDSVSGCSTVSFYQNYSRFDFKLADLSFASAGSNGITYNSSFFSDGEYIRSDTGCNSGSGIELEIADTLFDKSDISLTFRYRRYEDDGSFFERGGTEFSFSNGEVFISFRTEDGSGGFTDYGPFNIGYTIPSDDTFRFYSFSYDSRSGNFAFNVNGKTIWTYDGPQDRPLYWAGSGNAQVLGLLNGGCSGKAFFDLFSFYDPVQVTARPVPDIAGPDSICVRTDTVTYSVARNPGDTFYWNIPGGEIIGNTDTNIINVYWLTTGLHNITLRQVNKSGCDSIVTKNVMVNTKPEPLISGPDTVCEYTGPHSYNTPNNLQSSYSWTISGGSISGGQNTSSISVDWNAAGTGELWVLETNGFGCDTTVNYIVLKNPRPNPVISGPDTVCEYTTSNVYSTPSDTGSSYTWTISGGTITSGQNANSISVDWNSTGVGILSVQEINTHGCDTTITDTIIINPRPNPVITGPDTVCEYTSLNNYLTTSNIGSSYLWNIGGGVITSDSSLNSITATWNGIGTGNISVQEINTYGCDTTVDMDVLKQPRPNPAIIGPDTVCEYTTSNGYSTSQDTSATYSWTITGGSITSGQNTNSIQVAWNSTGTGLLTVTETNSVGCDTTVEMTVIINPRPNPVISGPDTVCEYTTLNSYSTTGNINNSYLWTISGGLITSDSSSNSIDVSWNGSGSGLLTLTEVNTYGCDTTVQSPVLINPRPNPLISGPDTLCEYTSSHSYFTGYHSGSTYSWTVSRGVIKSNSSLSAITVKWFGEGQGTLYVTETNSLGCDTTVSYSTFINPRPEPAISGPDTVCEYTTSHNYSTSGNTGSSYSWLINGGIINSGQTTNSVSVSWNDTGTGIISVKETNKFGCDTTVTFAVTIQPRPNPAIAGPDTVCEYTTGNNYSTTFNVGSTYLWTASGGTITTDSTQNSISVSWDGTGTGTLTVKETNSLGCDTTIIQTIVINPRPNPVITGLGTVCEYSGPHTYTTLLDSASTYSWNISGGNISGGQNTNSISVDWYGAGTGELLVQEINGFGCDTTVSLSVIKEVRPNPVISGPDTVCEYTTSHSYNTPSDTGSTYSWSVTGGTITSGQNSNSAVVDWFATGIGVISVQETNSLGCDTTIIDTIVINPRPNPAIVGPDTVCEYTSLNNYSTTFNAGSSWLWQISGGELTSDSSSNSVTATWYAIGTGNITVQETNNYGCDTTVNLYVLMEPRPNPAIMGPDTVCEYTSSNTYTTTIDSSGSYFWTINGGIITSGQNTNTVAVTWYETGTGNLTVKETNGLGCDTTVEMTIWINPRPEPAILGSDTICEYTTGHNYSTSFNSGSSYLWTVTGGMITSDSAKSSITVSWNGEGTGTLSVTETNSLGCDTTIVNTVVIEPRPEPAITGSTVVCEYTASHTYSTPDNTGSTYEWTVNGGVITSSNTGNAIEVDWNNTGTGTVSVKETNSYGCDTTINISVTIDPRPDPVISGPDTVCEYTTSHFYTTPLDTTSTFSWAISGGTITSGQGTSNVTVTWYETGTGNISVKETNGLGCDTTVTLPVLINPRPNPAISGPDTVCEFTTGHNYSTTFNTGSSYLWTVSGGVFTSDSSQNTVTVNWNRTGTGTLSVKETNSLGCDTTITTTVIINVRPNPAITGRDTVCEYTASHVYSTANDTGSSYIWTISGGIITSGTTDNEITATWNNDGTGELWVQEINSLGCDTTVTKLVTIETRPDPVISGPDTVCEYSYPHNYSTPSQTGSSYTWTVTGGTITAGSSTNAITVEWNGTGAGTVSVEEINASGCDTTVTMNVVINPRPNPVISGPDTLCEFTSGHNYSTPFNTGSSYSWTLNGGIIESGANTNTITVTWERSGPGAMRVIETNSYGCDTPVIKRVLIKPRPNPAIMGPDTVCEYTSSNTYTTTIDSSGSYFWTINGGIITSGQNTNTVAVTWYETGTGNLTVKETNGLGCDTTVEMTIWINPRPEPAILGSDTICEYTTGHNYSTSFNSGSSYLWTVTGGMITSDSAKSSITVSWNGEGTGTLSVTETNSLGCDTTIVNTVVIEPRPEPAITGPDTVCEFTTAHQYQTSLDSGSTYSWSVKGGTIVSGANTNMVDVNWNGQGQGLLYVKEVNNLGCDTTIQLSVTIQSRPDPVISGPDTVCEYSTSHFYTTPKDTSSSFNWTISGGIVSSGQGTNAVSVTWNKAGTGTISVKEINKTGCDTTVDLNVLINVRPEPAITGPDTVCEYTTSHSYSTPAQTGSKYMWTISGGTITSGVNTNKISVNWNGQGTGTLSVKEVNSLGCDTTILQDVVIKPRPEPSLNGPDSVCEFTPSISYSTPYNKGSAYEWNVQGGTIVSGQDSNVVTVDWMVMGTGTISVKEINSLGCDTTILRNITISPRPEPSISGSDTVCEYTSSHVYSTTNVSGDKYAWTISGGEISSGQGTNSIAVKWNRTGEGKLTLKEENSFGCDTIIEKVIIIDPRPEPEISGPDTVCEFSAGHSYETTNNSGSKYFWTVSKGIITDGQGTNSIVISWNGTGSGSVSVKEINSSGCDTTVTMPVIIDPRPNPAIAGNDTLCEFTFNQNYSTKANTGSNYKWTVQGGKIVSGQNTSKVVVDWGKKSLASISVTEINTLGCDTTIVIPVTLFTKPDPSISGPDTVCEFTGNHNYITPKVKGNKYQWTVSGGFIKSGANTNSVIIKWKKAGKGSVTLLERNNQGCDTLVTMNVLINSKPGPAIIGKDTVCEFAENSVFRVVSNSGSDYNWTVNGGTIVSGQGTSEIKVNWGKTGQAEIFVKETNKVGCDTTVRKAIFISPTPQPVIFGVDSICEYSTNVPFYTNHRKGNTYSWNVKGGIFNGIKREIVRIDWDKSGAGEVQVMVTDRFGCVGDTVKKVDVNPYPDSVIIGPDTLCRLASKVKYRTTAAVGHKYTWNVSNGVLTGGNGTKEISVDWDVKKKGLVVLKKENKYGCATNTAKIVVLHPVPPDTIIGSFKVCEFSEGNKYRVPNLGYDIVEWEIPDNKGVITQGQGTTNILVNWGEKGSAEIKVYLRNNFGCDTSFSFPVSILGGAKPSISGPQEICAYSKGLYVTNYKKGNKYQWIVNGGVVDSVNKGDSVFISWKGVGQGSIRLIEQNTETGCIYDRNFDVTLKGAPNPEIIGPDKVCPYTGNHVYYTPHIPNVSYTWNIQGGTIQSDDNVSSITVKWGASGKGSVRLYAIHNVTQCDTNIGEMVDKIEVTAIAPDDTAGCVDLTVPFRPSDKLNSTDYFWDFGDGNYSREESPVHTYTQPGEYEVRLFAKNKIGCGDTSKTTVIVHSLPKARFDVDYPKDQNYAEADVDKVRFYNKSKGGKEYRWDFGDGDSSFLQNPTHLYSEKGDYEVKLTVTSEYGCIDSAKGNAHVIIFTNLSAPNAFSPNGDGLNEYWTVRMLNIQELEVIIFDRWGTIVYRSKDLDFKWDGTYLGEKVPLDAYGYLIFAIDKNGNTIRKDGTITVIQ